MNLHYTIADDDGQEAIIPVSDQLQLADAVIILQAVFGSDLRQVKLESMK